MYKKEVEICNINGLHATVCSHITQLANNYQSDIFLHFQRNVIDVKSILGLLSLCIQSGYVVEIEATGPDEIEAVEAIVSFFETIRGER